MNATDHVYVHVPFCDGKCAYCAFYSELYTRAAAEAWLLALADELDARNIPHAAPKTLYIGGGTPSVLEDDLLQRLLAWLHDAFELDAIGEWTVEVNPGTVTPAGMNMLIDAGVTRISIGAQSFRDKTLQEIGRRHLSRDIDATVAAARAAGAPSVGIDLIAALPGVGMDTWHETLAAAVQHDPEHISVYSLTLEPGCVMAQRATAGELAVPPASDQLTALDRAEKQLNSSGYERYEISNYARPGNTCLHNVACWRGEDYIGLGPGASSRIELKRRTNHADMTAYAGAARDGTARPFDEETLSPEEDAVERFIFTFRLAEGVDPAAFCRRHPAAQAGLAVKWERELARLASDGLVECEADHWRLTSRGRNLADHVAEALV